MVFIVIYPFFFIISVKEFDIPKSEQQCRDKLKELIMKNKDVTDIRVIDMLVIKVSNCYTTANKYISN